MARTITFEVEDEDFVPREGVAVLAGWSKDGEAAIRVVPFEETPRWTQQGLLHVALDRARQIMARAWSS